MRPTGAQPGGRQGVGDLAHREIVGGGHTRALDANQADGWCGAGQVGGRLGGGHTRQASLGESQPKPSGRRW